MADFEIKRVENCDLYELLCKGKPVATNLTLDEAVDIVKEIQANDC